MLSNSLDSRGATPSPRRLRILVVHEVSYLKKPVYEYQDFAERLAARGHEVTVIDFDEDSGKGFKNRKVSRTGLGEVVLEQVPHNNFPILKYITGRTNFHRLLTSKLQNKSFDVVFLYSVFINGTQTVRLCRKYSIPVIYRVLDAYHLLRDGALTSYLLLAGERYIYKNASRLSVTNEKMRDYVKQVAPDCIEEHIEVVNHGVDTTIFSPRPRDQNLCNHLKIFPTDHIALFLGTTYSFSGLDALINQLSTIIELCPNFKLLIVGGGQMDEWLKKTVEERNLKDRVVLTGMVPYGEVPRYLSLADVAVNPFFINEITKNIVPIKILQYLSSGLPVLSSPLHDLSNKFPEETSGIVYSDIANPEIFALRLVELLKHAERRSVLSKQALSHIQTNYSIDIAVSAIENMLYKAAHLE